MVCVCLSFQLWLFDLSLLFFNMFQKMIKSVGWPDDCCGPSPILWHSAYITFQVSIIQKIFTTSKLHTINICCLLFCSPSYFSLALTFCWNNYSPRDSHQALPKHCSLLRTKKRGYLKQKIHWFFFQIQCISYLL